MQDLWPDNIFTPIESTTPVEILKTQATVLSTKTKNLLKGIVKSEDDYSRFKKGFNYAFYINAPTVNNYSYKLLTIHHDIDLYPVIIVTDDEIVKEVYASKYKQTYKSIHCSTEEVFVRVLGVILKAQKTRKVIGSLLSMITENKDLP